jgi:molybdopterin-binding protein
MSSASSTQKSPSFTHSRLKKAPSAEYRAWVDGKEAYVFNHLGFAGGTMSWVALDLHDVVEIRIRPHRHFDEARVLPRRAGISTILENGEIAFQISKPGNYMVEWDGLLELPLFVFARPPQEERGQGPAGRRIEFGPGDHHPGCIHLSSGDELHMAAGAEVYGSIKAENASNIRITGSGILNQSHLPFGGKGEERHPLELINCQDVLIDGPIFLEGCTWNIVFRDCDRVTIRNASILSERPYSTDGINPCDSRDVLVENCFIRSKDDCISVKGLQRKTPRAERKAIKGITVRDCLF